MDTSKNIADASITRTRYDRIACVYDVLELLVERLAFRRWRTRLWSQVAEGDGLEVGVGTGKNISYYPASGRVTAIDLSLRMLQRAWRKVRKEKANVGLFEMDVENLAFPDNTFDWAVATFVFCSVPNPLAGLQELARVVKPEGRILLLEHVRSDNPLVGKLMDLLNPLMVRMTGANINRVTVDNVRDAELYITEVEDLGMGGIVKLISGRSGSSYVASPT